MERSQRIPLRAELNFRDLGGYETGDGRRVQTGRVYRSAHLHEVDDVDRTALARLGIRTVCDLRHAEEAAARPGPFRDDPAIEVLPLGIVGSRATGDPVKTILEYGITEISADDITAIYLRFLDDHAAVYGRVVEVCAQASNHPVVVHCSAGKDRTGIAAALLLSLLGVDDETVVDDYALTNELWAPAQLERARRLLPDHGIDPEPLTHYFLAPPASMVATLAHVRERYGSVAGYLTGPCGVGPSTLDALADALLEEPPAR